jgi:hypothetical protein
MTEIVSIATDNEPAAKFLEPYVQSGNLNFLIGSGASTPAIKAAGSIESDINTLLKANNDVEADKKSFEFITAINTANSKISAGFAPAVKKVTKGYTEFLSSIDRILFARKNILLPRQANIFTTNYDMFLEHAASLIPGIILNDGFDRSSLIKPATFAPERYFDRTYRSGTFYRGPRIIATDRQAPRFYPRMIRLCSRFDSVLFTPKVSEISSYGNYSRSPIAIKLRFRQ